MHSHSQALQAGTDKKVIIQGWKKDVKVFITPLDLNHLLGKVDSSVQCCPVQKDILYVDPDLLFIAELLFIAKFTNLFSLPDNC